ncbi:hypothetical protein LVD13_08705 [Flavobacteriaceae bacterium D16]|nr:hypothetical protein [Flavobacteriaceae bacterium D16]
MKTFLSLRPLSVGLLLLSILFTGCKSDPKKQSVSKSEIAEPKREVIEVVTRSMEFFAPDTINSGWNTFVYKNLSTEPHFILLDKYPEGFNIDNTIKEVAPAFEQGMAMIMEGKMEEAIAAFGTLPEWFSQVVFSGGTGLISPQETAISTLHLAPGYYIMECYVKMPDGRFHTSMGMAKEFIIRDEDSGNKPPEASVSITISSTDGITYSGNLAKGATIFSVTYGDQIAHENFVGHDVNLVRMEAGADLDALEAWMNWATPNGLMSSTAPAGFTFLGGTNDAPEGSVHYFEAELLPGDYVLIAEVPDTTEKGMLKTFTIAD